MNDKALQREIDRRATLGFSPVSVKEMDRLYRETGYRLDREDDCRSIARIISGPGAGDSYPVISTGLKHDATGLRFANSEAPRDEGFRRMMELRGRLFAVTRGAILEV